jgi:hypothetical protein
MKRPFVFDPDLARFGQASSQMTIASHFWDECIARENISGRQKSCADPSFLSPHNVNGENAALMTCQ